MKKYQHSLVPEWTSRCRVHTTRAAFAIYLLELRRRAQRLREQTRGGNMSLAFVAGAMTSTRSLTCHRQAKAAILRREAHR